MKNSKSIVSMLIVLCMVLAFTACTNGSFDVMKENRTWTLTGIEVAGSLSEPFYFADDDLSSSLTVTATYSDREPRTVTGFTPLWEPGLNQTSVTISYTEGKITKTAEVSGSFHVAKAEARPTETPKALSGYEGSFPGGTYYAFGDFPQTVAPVDENGKELNDYTSEPIYRGYYLGSDGYFYKEHIEMVNSRGAGTTKYSDNSFVKEASEKNHRYFRVEPIIWRVLNTSGANRILLSEITLISGIAWYGSDKDRELNEIIYPANYKYSNIRAYLNGTDNQYVLDGGTRTDYDINWSDKGILQLAFTKKAQDLIAITEVDNGPKSTKPYGDPNRWAEGNPFACENTSDKIFLLSVEDVSNGQLGLPAEWNVIDPSMLRLLTDYAKANNAYDQGQDDGYWWLRSPRPVRDNADLLCVSCIFQGGKNSGVNHVTPTNGCIVPALTLPASSLQ